MRLTRYVITGTQEGELTGIPATGKRIEVAGTGVDYFSGGKIAESWEYYDVMGMMQQLGVIPEPGQQEDVEPSHQGYPPRSITGRDL